MFRIYWDVIMNSNKYLFSPFGVSLEPVWFAFLIFSFWVTKIVSGIVSDKPFSQLINSKLNQSK